jgi:GTPase SAR1 family protein
MNSTAIPVQAAPTGDKKVVIVGSQGCGKSSLAIRFCSKTFSTDYLQTYGADLFQKSSIDVKKPSLDIWSCGGHERFRPLLTQILIGANVHALFM